jgi:predicted RNase H-like HicB family nuclease
MTEDIEQMQKLRFVYWQDDAFWLGYLEEFPDYMTQGESLDELEENLRDIYKELTSDTLPLVRRVGELDVA